MWILSLLVVALATPAAPSISPAQGGSPAQARIAELEQQLERKPSVTTLHVALAMAYARRARETADTNWLAKAHAALDLADKLAPDDFEAARTRVWVLLGQHEFAAAHDAAQRLNARFPDDLLTYALLVDANIELGHYAEAEQAAQWLLDLRPGNIPGLTRAAYLREIFGDPEGAIELMLQALDRTAPAEVEEQAWLLVQISHLNLQLGRRDLAQRAVEDALVRFPGYHYALAQLAQVRAAQGQWDTALALRRQHFAAAPHPDNRLWLARALARAGDPAAAQREFVGFAETARRESRNRDNANRELVDYLAEEGADPLAAVALARREFSHRQDIQTRAALSWALYRAGEHAAAWRHAEKIIAVGTRDPSLRIRAGLAAQAAGHRAEAGALLEEALSRAPWDPLAAQARAALAAPSTATASLAR
jgi:tetratricopeptide (TPR) repeat protein